MRDRSGDGTRASGGGLGGTLTGIPCRCVVLGCLSLACRSDFDADDEADASSGTESDSQDSTVGTETADETETGDTETGGPMCGDGTLDPGEECDDGDSVDGNGCNADCSPSGEELWFVDLAPQGVRVVYDVVAHDGVAYWTGSSAAPADLMVGAVDGDGGMSWVDTQGGSDADDGFRVAIDGETLAVVGSRMGSNPDAWLLRYALDGQLQADAVLDVGTGLADASYALAVKSPGRWLAGGFRATVGFPELWIGEVDDAFELGWTDAVPGQSVSATQAFAIAVGGDGGFAAVGGLSTGVDESVVWVRAYDPDGGPRWTRSFTGDASGLASGRDAAFTSAGDLAVVGVVETAAGGTDVWITVLDENGNDVWSRQEDGGAGKVDLGRGVAVAPNGDVVVTGSRTAGADPDAWVARFSPDGAEQYWSWTHAGPVGADDRCYGASIDASGAIFVAGVDDFGGMDGPTGWIAKLAP